MRNESLTRNYKGSPTVGVVGGGQLAQMLAKAAKNRGVDLIVQTGLISDPAVQYANGLVLSATSDINGTKELASKVNCVTFENEWIDVESLSSLANDTFSFQPSLDSIEPLVDKLSQRKLLNDLNIPGPEWLPLSLIKKKDLELPDGWAYPLMAKAGRGGYDGKGTRVIKDSSEMKQLLSSVDLSNWFLEKWITYQKELAIVVSRDTCGRINAYPLTETFQHKQVCDWVIAPANVNHSVFASAYNIGASLLRELNYVGVLAIEFFYGDQGLLVNEIAPRTHNSAHFTIDACNSSQFDQQICIASGLPAPPVVLDVPGAIMINLLGLPGETTALEERLDKLKAISGARLHWYFKDKVLPGRKLGHITVPLYDLDPKSRINNAMNILKKVRAIWPFYVPDIH